MQQEFTRYTCQLALPGFTETAQQKLQASKVLIVGAGGLGCPAAQYLAASGIGTLAIADNDTISIGNLHRQILYTPAETGLKKVVVAAQKLQQQNPQIAVIAIDTKIDQDNALRILNDYDIILDATDNFAARYLLNDACVLLGKPLVYGAIYQYEGQVAVWNVKNADGTRTPNYRDVFPDVDATQVPGCAEGGVIPTLAGIIGCMQANEVLNYITGIGEILAGKILMLDAQTLQSRIIHIGTISKATISALPESEHVHTIAAEALKPALEQGLYHLIDVRTATERLQFTIGGLHIPLALLPSEVNKIATDKPVVFYCASGKRSETAVKLFMRQHPGIVAYSLQGGIKAWQEKYNEPGD